MSALWDSHSWLSTACLAQACRDSQEWLAYELFIA
jgi:hypothetical protein